jgi:hypothetical protein
MSFPGTERSPLVPLGFDDLLSITRSYLMQSFRPSPVLDSGEPMSRSSLD